MQLQEVMSHPVVTCPVDCTADVPARLMWEFDCGVIPLVDADGRIAGIVTDRDICMAALTQGRPIHEIAVSSVMTRDVMCCHPDESVELAEASMRDGRVRRVPVVDEDRHPVGVFSMNDLARLASSAKRSVIDRDLVRTLGAVSQPRGNGLHVPIEQDARLDVTV
jgi:CBS-domain-containing membrane protein